MSRYLVNKFLYRVDANPDALAAYMERPASYVAEWEREYGPRISDVETVTGQSFTDAERSALATFDFERLYASGAHPFLLFTIMIPILEREFSNFRDLVEHYTSRTRPHGRPRFDT